MKTADRPLRVVHVIGGGDVGGVMTHLVPLLSALLEGGVSICICCAWERGIGG